MNFAIIALGSNGRGGPIEVKSIQFSSLEAWNVKTLIQARNCLVKAARQKYREDYGTDYSSHAAVGPEPCPKPYACYAWEDGGATILVPEGTVYYDCIKHLNMPLIVAVNDVIACFNEDPNRAENLWDAI